TAWRPVLLSTSVTPELIACLYPIIDGAAGVSSCPGMEFVRQSNPVLQEGRPMTCCRADGWPVSCRQQDHSNSRSPGGGADRQRRWPVRPRLLGWETHCDIDARPGP